MKCFIGNIFIIFLLFTNSTPLISQKQTKRELIRTVQDADNYFYYDEDYEKAAGLYETILINNPGNYNFSAKLGICYLNIDEKRDEAIRLLSYASKNVVEKDKDYFEFGEKAPLDTYLYLAIAYHVNDSLEKALALYYDVKRRAAGTEVFREEYIDNQIRNCRYAIEMKKKPLTILSELFIPWLNGYSGASNPVISEDDSVFVFTQKKAGKTQIFCSYKNGNWQNPVNITKQLGGYDRFYSNSITGDGRLLVLSMDDGGDGNLYYSQRKDSIWSKIRSFGKPIKSIYWESHGFILPDGQTIYFSSNRPGGEGELDIWKSEKNPDGSWGNPVNCGNVINTPYNEDTPYFDPATSALIFSSVGHISMGGYDVFRSVFRNEGWTSPVAMPFAFNTTSDNTFFILNNNAPGFITSLFDEKTKLRNLYKIVAIDPADEITKTVGIIKLQDGMNIDTERIKINLVENKKGGKVKNIPATENGSFRFEIKPGDYKIIITYSGYKTDTINLSLPLYFLTHYLSVNSTLIPEKVSQGEFLSIKNLLFGFDSFKLDETAISELEILKSILVRYPEFKIEVAGYTDSKGTTEYNRELADKRAQSVIDYFVSSGVISSRFIKIAYGKSNFAAVNTNRDGSDNPEGRKYNRRVTFGIVDPRTGVTITQETYTPEHLKQQYSMRYSIVLIKTKLSLNQNHFSRLTLNNLLLVRSIKIDSVNLYSLGVFNNKPDATKYLSFVKENGFSEAYVVNQYDLNNESGTLLNPFPPNSKRLYTIQVKAARKPINMALFKGLGNVREIKSEDGYYRYVFGEYPLFSLAKAALIPVQESGYKDAFIRDINLLINK